MILLAIGGLVALLAVMHVTLLFIKCSHPEGFVITLKGKIKGL